MKDPNGLLFETAARIGRPGDHASVFRSDKIRGLHERGESDVVGSHDLEDIVTVIDGRMEIVDDVNATARARRASSSQHRNDMSAVASLHRGREEAGARAAECAVIADREEFVLPVGNGLPAERADCR